MSAKTKKELWFRVRLCLVISALIFSVWLYQNYWEFDFEVNAYIDGTYGDLNKEHNFSVGSGELSVFYNSINELAKIPSALDYKKICFTNLGFPKIRNRPDLPLSPSNIGGELKIKHATHELIIPMGKERCTQFKGDNFQFTWEFIYTPPSYKNVTLVIYPPTPEIELADGKVPLKYYTNLTITLEPISATIKTFLLFSVLCGFILFGNSVFKFVWFWK